VRDGVAGAGLPRLVAARRGRPRDPRVISGPGRPARWTVVARGPGRRPGPRPGR
jgi:hypothetical protein